MEKIKITLTSDEVQELYNLVRESSDTGDEEWDKIMKNIEQKILKVL